MQYIRGTGLDTVIARLAKLTRHQGSSQSQPAPAQAQLGRVPGVRPSSGAASFGPSSALENSAAPLLADVAAPAD
jgi:hypothetical protein